MNKKDTAVIKVLADLRLRKEPELTPEQEEMIRKAKRPDEQFLDDVEKLFREE